MPNSTPFPEQTRWDVFFSSQAEDRPAPGSWLCEKVRHLPPDVALDLGCGNGRNAVWLAQQGWKVIAIDQSTEAIAQLRRRNEPRIRAFAGDYSVLHTPRPFASLIVLSYAPLVPALPVIRQALRPKGHLLLEGFVEADGLAVSYNSATLSRQLHEFEILELRSSAQPAYHTGAPQSKAIQIFAQLRSIL